MGQRGSLERGHPISDPRSPQLSASHPNNLEKLKKHIRPGDVLLVEGKSRISQIIKYLTQSSWSHSAIYVGDHIEIRGHPMAQQYRDQYGEESRHLLLEAELSSGVTAVPLTKLPRL